MGCEPWQVGRGLLVAREEGVSVSRWSGFWRSGEAAAAMIVAAGIAVGAFLGISVRRLHDAARLTAPSPSPRVVELVVPRDVDGWIEAHRQRWHGRRVRGSGTKATEAARRDGTLPDQEAMSEALAKLLEVSSSFHGRGR